MMIPGSIRKTLRSVTLKNTSWNLSWMIQSTRMFRNGNGNSVFVGKDMMKTRIPGTHGILLSMSKRCIFIYVRQAFNIIYRYLIRYHQTRNGRRNRLRKNNRNRRFNREQNEPRQRNSDSRHKAFFEFFLGRNIYFLGFGVLVWVRVSLSPTVLLCYSVVLRAPW